MFFLLSAVGFTEDAIITVKQRCLLQWQWIIEPNVQQISIRHCDTCSTAL
ncbi:ferrous iron transporter A, partial [Staphylococcus aureus]